MADYTITAADGIDRIEDTTGASASTVDVSAADIPVGREITLAKADAGAGEARFDAGASGLIQYPGGSARYMYVGRQYQEATVRKIAANTWRIVRGVVQPVAGEPSLGTPHKHKASLVSTAPGNNNVQVTALPAAVIAAHPTAIEGEAAMEISNIADACYLYDTDGATEFDQLRPSVTGVLCYFHFKIPVDSSGNIRWKTYNYLVTTQLLINMTYYYC
jgi:hypothetical protein